MAKKKDIEAGKAFVVLYIKNAQLLKGLADAKKRLQTFGNGLKTLGASMLGVSAGILAPIAAAVHSFKSAGSALNDMSERTGASVELLSTLGYAARQTGAEIEDVEMAIRKSQKAIAEAASGSKTAADALGQIGLSVSQLQGLEPDAQFLAIAKGLATVSDRSKQTAVAMNLFGKSGTKLIPMVNDMDALTARAKELGIMSTADSKAAVAMRNAFGDVWKVFRGIGNTVGSTLAPVLTALANSITNALVSVRKWIKDNRDLVSTITQVALTVAGIGGALVGLGFAIKLVGTGLGGIGALVKTSMGVAGGAVSVLKSLLLAAFSPAGLVIAGVAAIAAMFVDWGRIFDNVRSALGGFVADFQDAWGGITDAIMGGDLRLALTVATSFFKLEWAKAKKWFVDTFSFENLGEVGAVFVQIWETARSAFGNFLNFVKGGIVLIGNSLRTVWEGLVATSEKMIDFLGLAPKVKAKNLVGMTPQAAAEYERAFGHAALTPEEAAAAANAKRSAGRTGFMDAFNKKLEDLSNQQVGDAGVSAVVGAAEAGKKAADLYRKGIGRTNASQDVADAQNAFDEARRAAREARQAAEDNPFAGPDVKRREEIAAMVGGKSVGTFSGYAAGLLGGGSPVEKIAANTKITNEQIAKLYAQAGELATQTIDAIKKYAGNIFGGA